MNIIRSKDPQQLGAIAGKAAAVAIQAAIQQKGRANIILATGTSQFETIRELVAADIDWVKVNMFHLDEYIGLPVTHPASFRKYLTERFLQKIPPLQSAYLINGEADPVEECARLDALIEAHPIDVALVGIGENGHLAFNDPPADFNTTKPYLVVNLDAACRQQQMNEEWFKSLSDVPLQAISMSVHQIMLSECIICSVPGERKARAVKNSLEQAVSNQFPASILQRHQRCVFYLDEASAAGLQKV
ncbi:glucosamine-6-phosphate deaminase [Chitinophaga polysaccharea]|uniref:glucosamine-6-phosphate deaminase n=1 Tax=Chitinophaga polysaccharea TaxID=1293035 RepID=UPI001455D5B8|nr:glucosamine-6-phosphate deaminase [Chitinophaga polysaccharea]NLR60779.1 glucosamine-6-phosphate deaminase [Chitinophaga polysaccharea]